MKYWLSTGFEVLPSCNGDDFLSLACLNYVDITFHNFQWHPQTCSLEKQILNELRVVPSKHTIPKYGNPYFYADGDGYTVNDWQLEEFADIFLDIIKPKNWNSFVSSTDVSEKSYKDEKDFILRWDKCGIQMCGQSIKEIILNEWDELGQCADVVDVIIEYLPHHYIEMVGNLFGTKRKLSKFVNDISKHERKHSQFVKMSDGQKGMLDHAAFACLSKDMKRPKLSLESLLLLKKRPKKAKIEIENENIISLS